MLITICSRGGSKGVVDKNIKEINGQPLIAYTIACAEKFKSKYESKIVLSTDSDRIREIASKYGLDTEYRRPIRLAGDNVSKLSAVKDILLYYEKIENCTYDYILDLDVTSPLRTTLDLINALKTLKKETEAYNIFSVSHSSRNPYFNMVELKNNGYVKLIKSSGIITARQQAPIVYDMNASFYIFRREFFHNNFKSSITDKSLAFVVPHICFDIDTNLDFMIMEFLLRENKLDFQI